MPVKPQRRQVALIDLGRTEYMQALDFQRRAHARLKAGETGDTLLLTEHFPVITTGRGADWRHLLVSRARLDAERIALVQVERGGDITYHGPGQLVAYPIVDLATMGKDLHVFIHRLEETAVQMLASYGVSAVRRAGAPGLYVGAGKIASLGVFVSRWKTMHGLAINLAPSVNHLRMVQPCGLPDTPYTSVALITGSHPEYAEACARYVSAFAMVFQCTLVRVAAPRPVAASGTQ